MLNCIRSCFFFFLFSSCFGCSSTALMFFLFFLFSSCSGCSSAAPCSSCSCSCSRDLGVLLHPVLQVLALVLMFWVFFCSFLFFFFPFFFQTHHGSDLVFQQPCNVNIHTAAHPSSVKTSDFRFLFFIFTTFLGLELITFMLSHH